jgi:hypothetical protein
MIQRIQTVYLSIAALACILLVFFPLAQYISDVQGTYVFYITGVKYMIDPPITVHFWRTFPLLALVAITFLLTVISIFLFKNRQRQVLIVNLAFLLQVIFVSLVLLYYTGYFEKICNTRVSYQFGVFVPLVSMGFLFLASRAIKKDDRLVRSTDRLR